MTTNVAKGGEAKFTCKTTGDAEGTITFHKAADNTQVGSVVATPATADGVVTTTGVLTIAAAGDADSFEYYCKATWSGNEVKSANVYLAVLGITETTPTAWGVNAKSAQFECKSDAVLKKNVAGDAIMTDDGKKIFADATVTWEYWDSATSTWKASTEDSRCDFTVYFIYIHFIFILFVTPCFILSLFFSTMTCVLILLRTPDCMDTRSMCPITGH